MISNLIEVRFCQKYGLNPDFKYTLVMYPRPEHRSGFDLDGICSDLLAAGKIPILKSRKKTSILATRS